jgi:hypothetical protein
MSEYWLTGRSNGSVRFGEYAIPPRVPGGISGEQRLPATVSQGVESGEVVGGEADAEHGGVLLQPAHPPCCWVGTTGNAQPLAAWEAHDCTAEDAYCCALRPARRSLDRGRFPLDA